MWKWCPTGQADTIDTTEEPSLKSDVNAVSKATVYYRFFMFQELCEVPCIYYLISYFNKSMKYYYTHLDEETGTPSISVIWPWRASI